MRKELTVKQLQKGVNPCWHKNIYGLVEEFNKHIPSDKLPHGWFATSWALNHAFYKANRSAMTQAFEQGFIYDDSDDPLPLPGK
jgi:hypothetical protein